MKYKLKPTIKQPNEGVFNFMVKYNVRNSWGNVYFCIFEDEKKIIQDVFYFMFLRGENISAGSFFCFFMKTRYKCFDRKNVENIMVVILLSRVLHRKIHDSVKSWSSGKL